MLAGCFRRRWGARQSAVGGGCGRYVVETGGARTRDAKPRGYRISWGADRKPQLLQLLTQLTEYPGREMRAKEKKIRCPGKPPGVEIGSSNAAVIIFAFEEVDRREIASLMLFR